MEKLDYLIDYLLKESGRENFDYSYFRRFFKG